MANDSAHCRVTTAAERRESSDAATIFRAAERRIMIETIELHPTAYRLMSCAKSSKNGQVRIQRREGRTARVLCRKGLLVDLSFEDPDSFGLLYKITGRGLSIKCERIPTHDEKWKLFVGKMKGILIGAAGSPDSKISIHGRNIAAARELMYRGYLKPSGLVHFYELTERGVRVGRRLAENAGIVEPVQRLPGARECPRCSCGPGKPCVIQLDRGCGEGFCVPAGVFGMETCSACSCVATSPS